jgi:hypothetical protein
MQKRVADLLLLGINLLAGVAVILWAMRPTFTSAFFLGPADEFIRANWPFRLVQPQWLGTPTDYESWSITETYARLVALFVAYVACNAPLYSRFPNRSIWQTFALSMVFFLWGAFGTFFWLAW